MPRTWHSVVNIERAPSTSGLAIAGLVFSILGWFSCGLLCIPGAFLSFLGLFSRGPKGTAVAGLIVGFPGIFFFAFVGLSLITAFLGIGDAVTSTMAQAERQDAARDFVDNQVIADVPDTTAKQLVESVKEETKREDTDDRPSESERNAIADDAIQESTLSPNNRDEPTLSPFDDQKTPNAQKAAAIEEAKWRTWKTANGKYSVEAKFIKFASGMLTLEKKDGIRVDVKLDILTAEDREFVMKRKWLRAAAESE
jgi:hypothetical protein